jgi:hypothetical protein
METYIVLKQGSYFIYSSEFIRGVEIRDSTNKIKQIINLKNSLKKAVNLDINDKILYPSNFIGLINIYIDEKGSGSGGGSVDSVNGQTGEVILKSADIGMTTNLGFPNVDSTIVGLSTILQTTMKLNSGTDTWVATNKRISLVAEPTDNSDASNKKYVDDSISNIPPVDLSGVYLLNGSKTMEISYIPTLDTDLITLKYFNDNSGGGSSGYNDNAGTFFGGTGVSGQGFRGGNSTAAYYSGGGGGADAQGTDSTAIANGGSGRLSTILGRPFYWGGGGGGAGYSTFGGAGGRGGGGA